MSTYHWHHLVQTTHWITLPSICLSSVMSHDTKMTQPGYVTSSFLHVASPSSALTSDMQTYSKELCGVWSANLRPSVEICFWRQVSGSATCLQKHISTQGLRSTDHTNTNERMLNEHFWHWWKKGLFLSTMIKMLFCALYCLYLLGICTVLCFVEPTL